MAGTHATHESAYGPRGEPAAMGVQEEAYHESYEHKRLEAEHGSGHGAEEARAPEDHTRESLTTAEMESNHDVPPFLRTNTRLSYFTEYIDFWRWEKIHWVMFTFWIAAALFTLTVFPPGSLLMFSMAGRLRNMAWYDRFVYSMFGTNRTLIVVD